MGEGRMASLWEDHLQGYFPHQIKQEIFYFFVLGSNRKKNTQTNRNTEMNGSVAGWKSELWCSSIPIS